MSFETCQIEGRIFNRDNPHIIFIAFYAEARRKVMDLEVAQGALPELVTRWNHYNDCGMRALRKAEEWETANVPIRRGPCDL